MTAPLAASLNLRVPETETQITVSEGFAPVIGDAPVVLLLGSLPGRVSLQAGEYYAQKRNAFWRIMGDLCDAGPEHEYAIRLQRLQAAGIALWDVLHSAVRPGSLDADIVRATEQANDIVDLLHAQPGIRLLAFNGRKAALTYERHVAPMLATALEGVAPPTTAILPSTSPAFAAMRYEEKLARWHEVLSPCLRAS